MCLFFAFFSARTGTIICLPVRLSPINHFGTKVLHSSFSFKVWSQFQGKITFLCKPIPLNKDTWKHSFYSIRFYNCQPKLRLTLLECPPPHSCSSALQTTWYGFPKVIKIRSNLFQINWHCLSLLYKLSNIQSFKKKSESLIIVWTWFFWLVTAKHVGLGMWAQGYVDFR